MTVPEIERSAAGVSGRYSEPCAWDEVRWPSDCTGYFLPSSARPGQVVMSNRWGPYQLRGRAGPNDTDRGMFQWLHLAGGHAHLRDRVTEWQPSPVMRGTRVGIAKVG
jgi:hypothetical protein